MGSKFLEDRTPLKLWVGVGGGPRIDEQPVGIGSMERE